MTMAQKQRQAQALLFGVPASAETERKKAPRVLHAEGSARRALHKVKERDPTLDYVGGTGHLAITDSDRRADTAAQDWPGAGVPAITAGATPEQCPATGLPIVDPFAAKAAPY